MQNDRTHAKKHDPINPPGKAAENNPNAVVKSPYPINKIQFV